MSYSEWSLQTWKAVTITQISSASISFCASSIMIFMIVRPKSGGIKTPYRRIIFGLSFADILQSFALISGPFSVPSRIEDSWGVGNEASCQANGVFLTIGQTAVPLYVSFLCLYYLCKLKYRMNDERFNYKVETKFHAFIVIFSIVVVGLALGLRVYNTSTNRSFCYFATFPLGCLDYPEIVGACDTITKRRMSFFHLVNVYILMFVCLCVITGLMVMLYKHARYLREINDADIACIKNNTHTNSNETGLESSTVVDEGRASTETNQILERVDHLSSLYYREVVIQATSYVGSFLLTNMPLILCFLVQRTISTLAIGNVLLFIATIFFPLGGLFNILVYTRPKVIVLQRNHPELWKLKCLWLVMKAGGEIPDTVDESVCCGCCSYLFCEKGHGSNLGSSIPNVSAVNKNNQGKNQSEIEVEAGPSKKLSLSKELSSSLGAEFSLSNEAAEVNGTYEMDASDSKRLELSDDLSYSRKTEFDSINFSLSTVKSLAPPSNLYNALKEQMVNTRNVDSSVVTKQVSYEARNDKKTKKQTKITAYFLPTA